MKLVLCTALACLAMMGCQSTTVARDAPDTERTVEIDFLYLDLETCGPCTGTGANLQTAIGLLAPVLDETGVNLTVSKTLVESEEQASQLGFMSSPTIRVGGRDIAGEVSESPCTSCEELCGEAIDCRVWSYRGQEHTAAPVGMILEAVLQEVYGGQKTPPVASPGPREVPENLKRFFASRSRCCPSDDAAPCCPPKEDEPVSQDP